MTIRPLHDWDCIGGIIYQYSKLSSRCLLDAVGRTTCIIPWDNLLLVAWAVERSSGRRHFLINASTLQQVIDWDERLASRVEWFHPHVGATWDTISTTDQRPAMEPTCTRCWLRTFCLVTEEPRGYQTDKSTRRLRPSIALRCSQTTSSHG